MVARLYQLRRGTFDVSRLRILPRGEHLLVMDRVSGRWLTLPQSLEPLLPLLGARLLDVPDRYRTQIGRLRQLLTEHNVGTVGTERRFSQLNTIILKLTNACNYACSYCYDFEHFERATVLSADLGTQALRQALDLVETDLWVILHGGEPMLMWELIEKLVHAGELLAVERGKRIHFMGQSNFSRLNDRVVEFSRAHAIAWGVSMDGWAEVHDRFRRTHAGAGTYGVFEAALARYPDFVRDCGVMSTITAANQSQLIQIARHFRDVGMASWDWSLFQPIGRGRSSGKVFGLDAATLVAAWDVLFDAVEAGEFDGFPILPVKKYIDNFVSGPGGNMCMRGECGAARDLTSISANGTVEACDCIDPTGPLAGLGNLLTSTLAAARESPVAQTIRARDLGKAPCDDCIWFGVCGGTCLAHAPSLDEVWDIGCAVAMRAFDRISDSMVASDNLVRYVHGLAA